MVFERDLYSLCAQAGKCPLPATILCTITKEEFIFLVFVNFLNFTFEECFAVLLYFVVVFI